MLTEISVTNVKPPHFWKKNYSLTLIQAVFHTYHFVKTDSEKFLYQDIIWSDNSFEINIIHFHKNHFNNKKKLLYNFWRNGTTSFSSWKIPEKIYSSLQKLFLNTPFAMILSSNSSEKPRGEKKQWTKTHRIDVGTNILPFGLKWNVTRKIWC